MIVSLKNSCSNTFCTKIVINPCLPTRRFVIKGEILTRFWNTRTKEPKLNIKSWIDFSIYWFNLSTEVCVFKRNLNLFSFFLLRVENKSKSNIFIALAARPVQLLCGYICLFVRTSSHSTIVSTHCDCPATVDLIYTIENGSIQIKTV